MQASGDSNPVPDSSAEPWSACEAYRYSDAGSPRASPRPWCTRGLPPSRSEEHTSELQSQSNLVCRLLLEKKTYIGQPLREQNQNFYRFGVITSHSIFYPNVMIESQVDGRFRSPVTFNLTSLSHCNYYPY